MTIPEVVNQGFLSEMLTLFVADNYREASDLLTNFATPIISLAALHYKDLEVWEELEDLTDVNRADIAYTEMGNAFGRICAALATEYDPLANYFTDREETDSNSGAITRSGNKTVTPSGTISNTQSGNVTHGFTGRDTVTQGTTYDAYSSDSDFKNIGKTIQEGTSSDNYNNLATTTAYNNFSTTETYNNVADTDTRQTDIEEHRSGNSGIFSKQDLTQREINLRMRNRISSIFLRMVVDVFNTGVYSSDG